jgi:hypothetical protein
VQEAKGALKSAEAERDLARIDRERQDELVRRETGALVTQAQLDPIDAALSVSTADLRALTDRVAAGEASNDVLASRILANGATYGTQGDLDFVDSTVDGGTHTVILRAFCHPPLGRTAGLRSGAPRSDIRARRALTIPQCGVKRDLQCTTILLLIAVPVALAGTFAVMIAMGFSLNTVSLLALGLAIWIVVDDVIVVVDAKMEEYIDISPADAARAAMAEIAGPILAITLVLLSVFVPVAFVPGISGHVFQQFAVAVFRIVHGHLGNQRADAVAGALRADPQAASWPVERHDGLDFAIHATAIYASRARTLARPFPFASNRFDLGHARGYPLRHPLGCRNG